MDSLLQDLRYAFRQLLGAPGFTVLAVLTLGLGIGANTAIFSVVNAVLLRPVPYPKSEELVTLHSEGPLGESSRFGLPYPTFEDIAQLKGSLASAAVYRTGQYNLTSSVEPREIEAAIVSPSLFDVLGVRPVLGRPFTQSQEQDPVAVLSHRFWQSAFASDSSVLGKTVSLDGRGYEVIGVLPPGIRFSDADAELWIPIGWSFVGAPGMRTNRNWFAFTGVARLQPAITIERLRGDLDVVARRIDAEREANSQGDQRIQITTRGGGGGPPPGGVVKRPGLPGGRLSTAFVVTSIRDEVVGDTSRPLEVLAGAVGLVLLIACANAAGLLVARAARRKKEISVRRALGAERSRLIRQLLTESVLLALGGAVVGVLLAKVGLQAILATWPAVLPRANEIDISGMVLLFTLGLSLLTGVAFGLVPALKISSPVLEEVLRDESGVGGGRQRRRIQSSLIVAEVGLALVLLVGAGLLLRSFLLLNQVDPGFNTRDILAGRIRLTPSRYSSPEVQQQFFDDLLAALRRRPGVTAVTTARTLPLSGARMMLGMNPRDVRSDDPDEFLTIGTTVIGPDFFSTLQIPLLQGRAFTAQDDQGAPRVAVINTRLARRLWPGQDPLGKVIPMGVPAGQGPVLQQITVVGVVGDIHGSSLAVDVIPEMFLPLKQSGGGDSQIWVAMRGPRPRPLALAAVLREAVRSLDSQQPVAEIASVAQMVARDQSALRLNTTLVTVFGGLAGVLAIIGIYGITAYAVSQRTREFGVRMALGGRPADVMGLVLRENLWLVASGVLAGTVIAVVASRTLASLLYGIRTTDALTFVTTAILLSIVAMAAAWLPARRATKVDPVEALRIE